MAYKKKNLFDLGIVDIENKQILQNEVSLGRWIVDAITLLLSLGESCKLKERIPIKQMGFSYIPDIYLEKGCDALNLKGKTILEIKNKLLSQTEIKQSEIYSNLISDGLLDNILVIYITPDKYGLKECSRLPKVEFVPAEEFINQAKIAIRKGLGEINKTLRKGKKHERREWTKVREARLANAVNDMSRYDCALFLGAGVSASAGILNWNNLLKSLLSGGNIINSDDFDDVYRELDFSNLLAARYIQKSLNVDNKEFVNRVRNLLYPDAKEVMVSDLISSICEIIKNKKNVESVITYNYDTLIEEKLNDMGKRSFAIYRNNLGESKSFPVYHVHGIIFREHGNGDNDEIILSEDDYHRVYSEVFDWSNVEQLHALTRCTCYFIGLSMKDPNLRRLLEIASKDRSKAVRHYVFLERKSFSEDVEKEEKDFQTREDMFADLGLNVIWYEGNNNHKELPELLKMFVNDNNGNM